MPAIDYVIIIIDARHRRRDVPCGGPEYWQKLCSVQAHGSGALRAQDHGEDPYAAQTYSQCWRDGAGLHLAEGSWDLSIGSRHHIATSCMQNSDGAP